MLLFLGLVVLVLAVSVVVLLGIGDSGRTSGVARSLELVNYQPTSTSVAKNELAAHDRFVAPVVEAMRRVGERLSPGGAAARIARSLDKAGNPSGWTIERIMAAKAIAMVLAALVAVLLLGFDLRSLLMAALAAVAGFFLPDLLVYDRGVKRQQELTKGLADALDMLTVCVQAGQGFDAAIMQVAKTVTGPIGGEFARVLSEMQIGKTRGAAFAALGDRVSTQDVKNFVSALVQADRMGLPITDVLREQTKEMRIARRQRAEEKAQKVTVKILFPLLLCIFPALFIIIIGPGGIRIVQAFSGL